MHVQVKATQAYPDPIFPPVPTAILPNDQAEIDREQNAQNANQPTLWKESMNATGELQKSLQVRSRTSSGEDCSTRTK